ncbi:MAG: hypothetical protein HC879_19480 [Leptolyngbyaceae cyanobacterium SL_5_9]|nr:hypothetical protein [Leptolyngbyaceae cyanobacterium SL_5_9]
MPDQYSLLIPQASQPEIEILASYRVAYAFYEEVRLREALEEYSEQYQQLAEQHRQELAKMQSDLNLLGWFYRAWGKHS